MNEEIGDKKYKEDSTRGNSLIHPLNYKHDVNTQAWMDSRILATLSIWMEKNGAAARNFSDVTRRPLEMLVEILVRDGLVEMVEDTIIARQMLESKYKIRLNRGDKGGKNILHNQVLSEQRKELGEFLAKKEQIRTLTDNSTPIMPQKKRVSDQEMYELMRIYSETGQGKPIEPPSPTHVVTQADIDEQDRKITEMIKQAKEKKDESNS